MPSYSNRSTTRGSLWHHKIYSSVRPTPRTIHHNFQNAPPRPSEHDAHFSFELTGDRGAALVTRHQTFPEDTGLETAFETYTKRHYKSWVEFARRKGYGNDIHPVLVSGIDMTRDFSMVVYSKEDDALTSNNTVAIPMFACIFPPFLGTWRSGCPIDTNEGPQESGPSSLTRAVDALYSRLRGAETAANKSNQCVFIRYYTMRSRKWMPMLPKVIRAGAGPHDLGPGDNRGDTLPELGVQYDAEHLESGDEDLGPQWGPTTDDTSSGSNIVVRYVWFLLSPSAPTLNFAPRRNMTAGMPLQITYSR